MTRMSTRAISTLRSRPPSRPKHARSCEERDKDEREDPRTPPIEAGDAEGRTESERSTGEYGARRRLDRQRDVEPPSQDRTADQAQQVNRAEPEHDDIVEFEVLRDLGRRDQRATSVRAPSTSVCTTRLSPSEAWNAKP